MIRMLHIMKNKTFSVEQLEKEARAGDVICVFSNGGFGGIHDKLLARFSARRAA